MSLKYSAVSGGTKQVNKEGEPSYKVVVGPGVFEFRWPACGRSLWNRIM